MSLILFSPEAFGWPFLPCFAAERKRDMLVVREFSLGQVQSEKTGRHDSYSMDSFLFIEGLVIGFSIAAPVGPIGLLCIVRTLSAGRAAGLASGLGAATADGVYGFIGGFGVTFLAHILIAQHVWFRLFGGIFLVCLGLKYLVSKPRERGEEADNRSLLADFGSTFLLTLTNPMTIISFGAVFASFGVGTTFSTYRAAITLLIGIFCGSALWWVTLSFGVNLFRPRIEANQLVWINRAAGTIIAGFGIAALVSLAV
ncbi:MAG: LysE family translocator [Deltaproteobacteria bacterium]